MRFWLALALLAGTLDAETLTKNERDQAMSHLHATRKLILDFIGPLSESQWNYKPAPARWSIAECAEHITETEKMLRGLILQTAKTAPVDETKRGEKVAKREQSASAVLTAMTDRSKRYSAPGEAQPKGRFKTKDDFIATFKTRRDETIQYVESTSDDLRGRFFNTGASEMDLYEMILMISGHTERHLLQMKEVAATAGYPRK